MILARRSFLTGLTATLIAAPAIVRASSLMKVKVIEQPADVTFGVTIRRCTGTFQVGDVVTHSGGVLGVITKIVSSDLFDVALKDSYGVVRMSRNLHPEVSSLTSMYGGMESLT